MKRYNYLITIFVLIASLKSTSLAGDNISPKFNWQIGEELTYRVKWLVLNVGTLKFQILGKDSLNGHPVYHCRFYLDSNPSLPFVDIHEVYDSFIDEDNYSQAFRILVKKSDCDYIVNHNIDYNTKKVKILVSKCTPTDTSVVMDSTLTISGKIQDGVSILYFSRARAAQQKSVELSVLSFKEVKPARISFSGKTHRIGLHDKQLPAYYLDGSLKFMGIGGIKEGFKGWFSTDAQRVPLKAKMKAFLGSVKIELVSWKNWVANEDIVEQ